ncbi:MAG: NUMOD4 domain-containing protein [Acutalibacteraceae bacterium]|nr:NUMOD4 domain-containing protein [Acutalibacteraceae bacterium]
MPNDEVWKKIAGFERYSVSNLGRVKNNKTEKILSVRKASNGYLRVNLRKGNVKYEKPTVIAVHRLVAEAFLTRVSDKQCVNHIDGNKTNNHINNLEWVSNKENTAHAIKNSLMTVDTKEIFLAKVNSEEAKIKHKKSQNSDQYRIKQQINNKNNGKTKTVVQKDMNTLEIVAKYDNCYEAARAIFKNNSTNKDRLISRCARGKVKSAYGYYWEYEEGR